MRARRTLTAVAALTVILTLVAGPGAASSSVSAQLTGVDGSSATVTGSATFTEITEPVSVGEFGFPGAGAAGGSDAGAAAGLALNDALIFPLEDGSGVRFTWVVDSLPDEVPPEGVRYTWAFRIGTNEYQLQAKRTNVVSVTTVEDPQGHALHATDGGDWFQLRGACEAEYLGTPVSGCYHLAFLDGEFDTDNGLVHVDLPWETTDRIGRVVASDFVPGAEVIAHETATMSIAASFQAFVSNTHTSRWINDWGSFITAPTVDLGVGRSNQNPAAVPYTATADLADDGSFAGTVSGLTATNDTVFVRACYGVDCSYTTLPTG